jgi:hypothetical protein
MGKAAHNERIRLRATFLNNLSLGASIAGALAPCVALWAQLPEFLLWTYRWWSGYAEFIPHEIGRLMILAGGTLLAIVFAIELRKRADREIRRVED